MKGKSKKKPGRVHWRDKQSIMCGVEEGPGGALLPHFLLGKVILLFMKQKKIKIFTVNMKLEKGSFC